MIFFVGNDGTIVKSMPSPVYQGSANANTIYLVAPFASGLTAAVAFQLPNGIVTEAVPMAYSQKLSGIINKETGQEYSGWTYSIPSEITEYYGTVTAQFYFYNETGVITATSATNFQVAKGVPAVLPNEPSADVYEQILSNFASLQKQLSNGAFAARAIYAWNSAYIYGANEMTFYPKGEFGSFIKSLKVNNTAQPYFLGVLNSEYWQEIVNFDTIKDEFFTVINECTEIAKISAISAKNSADNLASLVDRQIKFVPELPEKGDEKLIYAIVSNVDGNLFDLYAWINGERHYFGSANLVTDTDKQFFRTLKADGWKSNKQHFEIDGLSNASKILVTPIDSCAAQYLSAGIELSTDENTLVITCENTPTEDLEILIQIQYLTEIPSLSGYYTIPQIDGKVGNKVKLTIDNETYVMTMQLISADGTVLSTGVIDLPLESMVVGGRYDNDAEKIVLTLKNGSSVDIPAADIIDGLASQTALDTEIQDRKDADTVLQSKLTKKVNLTLDKNAWGNRVQTLSVAGVTGINSVNVYPKDESAAEYILCGVSAIQAYGLVTFTCAEVPTKNLLVTAEIAG